MDSAVQLAIGSAEHARVTSRIARWSVIVALLLIALKLWAWQASSSVAMLSSLADSTLDLAGSMFTFFAVRYAAAPPDREHRFGHGKAEAFAGLVQSGLVGASSIFIAVEAVSHILNPVRLSHGWESVAVMLVSIGLTGALVAAQTRAIQRTGSVATRADRLHYASDLAANLVVIGGIAAAMLLQISWADAIAALIVAGWLGWGAVQVGRESANHLLDREVPEEVRQRIRALAEQDKRLLKVHELRTRTSGPYMHVQFHAELDPDISLVEAHHIVVAAEERIRAEFPSADIIIHPDPKDRAPPHGHEDFEPAHS
ncbi:MAG: cation diffusion facilitator family transporter [Hyphomonadaceae bacterium]|nr:cation diffusion facilitator family transporter [Hyphomonadaceae bacterium]